LSKLIFALKWSENYSVRVVPFLALHCLLDCRTKKREEKEEKKLEEEGKGKEDWKEEDAEMANAEENEVTFFFP